MAGDSGRVSAADAPTPPTAPGARPVPVPARDDAVRELLALTGRAVSALRERATACPQDGVTRALLVLTIADTLPDAVLKDELVIAHADARQDGTREVSLVYGIYLYTHRQWQMTADHLVTHFARWPADDIAGLMLGAFDACDNLAYRAQGVALTAQQYTLAGPENWAWASWMAAALAEQGRPLEAHDLAGQALALNPRSGTAAHARAHAEHELGAGPDATAFIDGWLATDPHAMQARHLHWHAALQSIASGNYPDARRRADTMLARTDVGMRSAVNWRLLLAGQEPARRCDPEHVRELLAAPGGMAEAFHTFNLALALAAEAATDDLHALAARAATDTRPAYREVLAPVVGALAYLTAGHPQRATDLLTALGDRAEHIGGVRVEREIIRDTLARALIQTGQHARAATLLEHRTATRHHHTYENHLLTPTCERATSPKSHEQKEPYGCPTKLPEPC